MISLNVTALTLLSHLFVRDYKCEEATLVNISSAGGYSIVPRAVSYCASKFYVSALSEGLYRELAADGKVVYAGAGLRGYGNLLIVQHTDAVISAYAHNRALLVKEKQTVKKGQRIAEMGDSHASRVMLRFEIRNNGKLVDPLRYLPAR